jgi:hypothetical protein
MIRRWLPLAKAEDEVVLDREDDQADEAELDGADEHGDTDPDEESGEGEGEQDEGDDGEGSTITNRRTAVSGGYLLGSWGLL